LGVNKKVRVLLVDDACCVRERLAELLLEIEGVEIAGQAGDVPTAVRLIERDRPDVLVMDVDLPGRSGLELLETLRRGCARPVIIVLSYHDVPALRSRCAQLGASFYFYKPEEVERVAEVCQDLARRP
jgi:two-component system response regulator DesR